MTGQELLARPRRFTTGGVVIIAVIALFGCVLVGGGVQLIVQRDTGQRVQAKVTDCETRGTSRNRSTHCTGSWVTGGSLLEGGRVHFGTIDGVDTGDVGKTISATVSDDGAKAYSRSLAKPLVLIGLGALTLLLGLLLLRTMLRAPRAATAEVHLPHTHGT